MKSEQQIRDKKAELKVIRDKLYDDYPMEERGSDWLAKVYSVRAKLQILSWALGENVGD